MHVNDFPTEILEEIFLRSISDSQERLSVPPFARCSGSPAIPSIISKICKRWKDVALNFSPLWTHLHVVDPQDVGIVQDLEVWMNRAGTLPLCLSFRQLRYGSSDLEACVAVVTLFLNSLHRCQSFEMVVLSNIGHFGLENIERIPSTSLQSVNMWCRGLCEWRDEKLLSNLLLNNRNLRTIHWSHLTLHCPHHTIPHPWENLRELSIDDIEDTKFLNALSHCQNLERLAMHNRSYNTPSKAIPVILPLVTHLSIAHSGFEATMLSQLILPSLAELEIVLCDKLTRWTLIVDLLKRSGAVLRRLGIFGSGQSGHLYQSELIRVLKMPYFQELKILEIEELMTSGCGIAKFLTLPNDSNTASTANDETSGYLVHLERIFLVFQGTGKVKLSPRLQKLVESRLGRMSDRESARWHIEIGKQIRFSLSIPPT